MKKENKFIVVFVVLFSIIAVIYCIYLVINRNKNVNDAIKFRNEYMKFNDKMNEENNKLYFNVNISKTNTVKYLSSEEVIKMLQKGTGLIYFGSPTSNKCRNIISLLTEIAEENKETIYYFNISNIASSYEIANDELKKVKEGSKNYYQILDLLTDYLTEYYLVDENGKEYIMQEKQIFIPTLVMVNAGEIVGFYEESINILENSYDKLKEEEIEELKKNIMKIINSKRVNDVCTIEKC